MVDLQQNHRKAYHRLKNISRRNSPTFKNKHTANKHNKLFRLMLIILSFLLASSTESSSTNDDTDDEDINEETESTETRPIQGFNYASSQVVVKLNQEYDERLNDTGRSFVL